MKYKLEIRSYLGNVLFTCEREDREPTIKEATEAAVSARANLARANLAGANLARAYLARAYLARANLAGANLARANLARANLAGANLAGAYLARANLAGANLAGADIAGANLEGADGLNKHLCTPLRVLLDQPGKIRAYKLVKPNGVGPYNGGIVYEIGKDYEVSDADTDEQTQCGAGINLATMDWCLKEWKEGYRIFIAEFEAKDIAAIPTATDGKFRCHRCSIVGEKDLKELDWPPKKPETTNQKEQ